MNAIRHHIKLPHVRQIMPGYYVVKWIRSCPKGLAGYPCHGRNHYRECN